MDRRRLAAACIALSTLVAAPPATASSTGGHSALPAPTIDTAAVPPPIYVDGARIVDIRNTTGGFSRYYSIPSGSVFRSTGGAGEPCSFVPSHDGVASNGETYVAGQRVYSERWIFEEGTIPSFFDPTPDTTVTAAPLDDARRIFHVFCDSKEFYLDTISVGSRDPMIDPRTQLVSLFDHLQLVQPVVYRNPIVDRWGGLVTRYPTWLAIQPAAWTTQRSATVQWRGWSMSLVARPVVLRFALAFRPDADRPTTPYTGIIGCIDNGQTPTIGSTMVPLMPTLASYTTPGVNGPCLWTPPGPGRVAIQARIVYRMMFWANAYYEAQPDYAWASAPATYLSGELSAVNLNG